jgi:hypothetical protein
MNTINYHVSWKYGTGGFGVQTRNCRLSSAAVSRLRLEGWRRVEVFRILVSVFFLLNIFVSKFELFGCRLQDYNKYVDLGFVLGLFR